MIAGVLTLSRQDMMVARLTDPYSIHRLVYDLFEDVRTESEKSTSIGSGFLYADKGGTPLCRQILFLSNREPHAPKVGTVELKIIPESFLMHSTYRFEIVMNPVKKEASTGKYVPIKGREAIATWFIQKSARTWGFTVNPVSIDVREVKVLNFVKKGNSVTMQQALVSGHLEVTDRNRFVESFKQGIGRGKAFGCGLLQIVPITL